ncbi:MAG: hypothetical protein H6741_14610 [Alphaproteobacteria bacterium]|nr:hypothetical protein [Alphaproteobacteria bacterium]MCB9793949.1 hypothetical protein [Alphaproteobacteria bacterium]
MKKVLLIKCGGAEPAIVERAGDYHDWFLRRLPGPADVVELWKGEALPDPEPYAGVLLSGSPLSVRDELAWMAPLGRWALARAQAGQPVLGVCFGHQLLGEALGGRVELNPGGPERGTVSVQLTEQGLQDPLFMGFTENTLVNQLHGDALVIDPPGAQRLAGNPTCRWQAFAWGPMLRAVQFHPEVDGEAMAAVAESRGWDCPQRPNTAYRVLENWWRGWID